MRREFVTAILFLGIFLASAGLAYAQDSNNNFGNPENVLSEVKSIGGMILAAVFLIFIIVACYTIIQAIVDAVKTGRWGNVVVGIVMVLIAGLAIWAIVDLSGQNPQEISNKVKVDGK